jgi:hypothetical protein
MAWSHKGISLDAAPPLALASLRRLKLRHSKSHAWFTHSLRDRCPTRTEEYPPMLNKVVRRCALVAALSMLAEPGLPGMRRRFIRGRGQSTTGSFTSLPGMS